MRALSVASITHPFYEERYRDWRKWRFVYQGGQRFIENYLEKFSIRESRENFEMRRKITYNPAFAKEAIDEIKNSIFQRLVDISRKGGSKSYHLAMEGKEGGVDLGGSSMNAFIGRKLLVELLTMARVGVFVDMPQISGVTQAETLGYKPYLYLYLAEDIRSWTIDDDTHANNLTNVLLREYTYEYDTETGLPIETKTRYRRLWLSENGTVLVRFYTDSGDPEPEIFELNIPKIPFVLAELSDSLLADVANYQIGLLNLASSDIAYTLYSNYPFYTEQFDPRGESPFIRPPSQSFGGQEADATAAKPVELKTGITSGRRYPVGTERPAFIYPSSEPLKASMDKQDQMKQEIRMLVNLAVTNLIPRMASAQSKGMDQEGLECGLSYIGLELEQMERKVAEFWAMYERNEPATVHYPETYDIKTVAERDLETDRLIKLLATVPSATAQKEIAKQIVKINLSRKVSVEVLNKIYKEIDSAEAYTLNPDVINAAVMNGYLDLDLAAKLSGYPKETVKKASDDHADRLARIQENQQPKNNQLQDPAARGLKDLDGNPAADGTKEKQNSRDKTQDPELSSKVRGKGK